MNYGTIIVNADTGRPNRAIRQQEFHCVPTYFLIDAAGKIAYNSDKLDPELLETEKYIQQFIRQASDFAIL